MVGRLLSFWDTIFSGAILVSGRVSVDQEIDLCNIYQVPPNAIDNSWSCFCLYTLGVAPRMPVTHQDDITLLGSGIPT